MKMFRFKFDRNRNKNEEFDFFEGQGGEVGGSGPPFQNCTLNYYWYTMKMFLFKFIIDKPMKMLCFKFKQDRTINEQFDFF